MAFKDWFGAAAGAAGAIGGSMAGNMGNKNQQNRATRNARTDWNMQNEYNHPSAQMARLREAGLNPNLIYGQSSGAASGQASPIHQVAPAKINFNNPMDSIGTVANVQNTRATTDNVRAKTTNTFQDTALKSMQTAHEGIKGARSAFDLNLAKDLRQSSLQAAQWGVKQQQANFIESTLDITFKDKTMIPRIMDTVYRVHNAKETLRGQQLSNSLKQFEKDLNSFGLTKTDPAWARIMGIQGKKLEDVFSSKETQAKAKGTYYGLWNNPANILK